MTALSAAGLLSFGIGCLLVVKHEVQADGARCRAEVRRLHALGDYDAAAREAHRSLANGPLLTGLCAVGLLCITVGSRLLTT